MKNTKAQVAMESMVMLGILLLMFIGVYAFYSTQNNEINVERSYIEEQEECMQLAQGIISTYMLRGNITKYVEISSNMYIDPIAKIVVTQSLSCSLIIGDDLGSSVIYVTAGTVQIQKNYGDIVITNV